MTGIFISYRRHDSAGWTGHLSERLEQFFGPDQIFMDIEKIEAGTDFIEAIESAVSSCNILLAVIGPGWLTSADTEGRRRLDNEEDFIRLEIATALSRNIRVIPVLVGGGAMPASSELPDILKPLTRRQAHELADNRWDYDTEQLVKIIEKAGIARKTEVKMSEGTPAEQPGKISAKAIISIVIAILILMSFIQNSNPDPDTRIGGLAMALVALTLGGIAFFDIKVHKTRGKILAITGISLSGLALLVYIGLLSSQTTLPKPDTLQQTSQTRTQPTPPQPINPEPAPKPAAIVINGLWAGSDGMTYNLQQQGNMVAVIGGYPNQAIIVNGSGVINGQNIDLEYFRLTDGTGGKARLTVSGNGRTIRGQYRNLATGEAGEIVFSR